MTTPDTFLPKSEAGTALYGFMLEMTRHIRTGNKEGLRKQLQGLFDVGLRPPELDVLFARYREISGMTMLEEAAWSPLLLDIFRGFGLAVPPSRALLPAPPKPLATTTPPAAVQKERTSREAYLLQEMLEIFNGRARIFIIACDANRLRMAIESDTTPIATTLEQRLESLRSFKKPSDSLTALELALAQPELRGVLVQFGLTNVVRMSSFEHLRSAKRGKGT